MRYSRISQPDIRSIQKNPFTIINTVITMIRIMVDDPATASAGSTAIMAAVTPPTTPLTSNITYSAM